MSMCCPQCFHAAAQGSTIVSHDVTYAIFTCNDAVWWLYNLLVQERNACTVQRQLLCYVCSELLLAGGHHTCWSMMTGDVYDALQLSPNCRLLQPALSTNATFACYLKAVDMGRPGVNVTA